LPLGRLTGRRTRIHIFFIPPGWRFTSCSRRWAHPGHMADFLSVLGIVVFVVLALALIKGLEHV
jgi:hypothetical protein